MRPVHPLRTPATTRRSSPWTRLGLLLALALLTFAAGAYTQSRVLKDADGKPVRIQGSVVMIEPDIELFEISAGGVAEPRQEWSDQARTLYPKMVGQTLSTHNIERKPDFELVDDLDPNSTVGQLVRLNQAVSYSILVHTSGGMQLATKKNKQLDWTLGPSVQAIQKATGADYALFTYIQDSYASPGRKAMRVAGILLALAGLGGGDVGGGRQVGVTTLVDLRSGQVVWFNFISKGTGDLRDEEGARNTAKRMLKDFPL